MATHKITTVVKEYRYCTCRPGDINIACHDTPQGQLSQQMIQTELRNTWTNTTYTNDYDGLIYIVQRYMLLIMLLIL